MKELYFSIINPSRKFSVVLVILSLGFVGCKKERKNYLDISKNARIVLVGNNTCARMMEFGYFEAGLQIQFPDSLLFVRNMCDGGNTPGFRPHSGRNSPWAFNDADKFQTALAKSSGSEGHFESPDQWLTRLQADIILAFFGYNESFNGPEGVENFMGELDAYIKHTIGKKYNGKSPPQLALVSPLAFENLSETYDLPDGLSENMNLSIYTDAMKKVANSNQVHFIDAFKASKKWFNRDEPLTIDGNQLNDAGNRKFSQFLIKETFGIRRPNRVSLESIVEAVKEKNWYWQNDFKIPNGVHVFGRRFNPFGPDNYPYELEKIRQLTAIRDTLIWSLLSGNEYDVEKADSKTIILPEVETNYEEVNGAGNMRYLYGDKAVSRIYTAPGYEINMFASEEEFPDLANPVQLSFDNEGRLWVAVMPSYPHYKPGDPKPNDKLLILEDTDGDNKADKQIIFAKDLHLPIGFEIAPEGVYVSQGTHLKLFTDTDGDDVADKEEIIFSGFDDHDTHHAISAFTADPSGAIYMAEGIFLHTNVETAYGPVRATNGGFYRFNPARKHLERTAQLLIPNPWGIAFDDWGQNFYLETSGPALRWMMPGSINPRYGVFTHKSFQLIEEEHLVRPTSGLEFVSSRHFPPEVQGDILLNNTIGYLGTKQHSIDDDGTGYSTKFRQDLLWSDDKNFRPVDLEFAPDGSLYLVDWHNILVGHMQHNARDPLRDHVHGRIYRVTYPARPLVEPAKINVASIEELLDNLKLPEYRSRYRTRRELRGRDPDEVLEKMKIWTQSLDQNDPDYDHHLLEALWVSWGLNRVDGDLLNTLIGSEDFRIRAAIARVLRYVGHQVPNQIELLQKLAGDKHGRVRLEAIVAASWMEKMEGLEILKVASENILDEWMVNAYLTAEAHLNGEEFELEEKEEIKNPLTDDDADLWEKGRLIYEKDGYCGTCHQYNGSGLPASGFPPLAGSNWVSGSEERLIKLTLKGLHGPISVLGKRYTGQVPMTAFENLLTDEEVASVLTYVRNSFGNQAPSIYPELVTRIREGIRDKKGFYRPDDLLEMHPN